MKRKLLVSCTILSIIITMCLCGVSCRNNSENKQYEEFFPKVDLPSITVEDAVKRGWINMGGYFIDKEDDIDWGEINLRLLPNQLDEEKGIPVIVRIPANLFLSKYTEGMRKDDADYVYWGGGYLKDGELKIYRASHYVDEAPELQEDAGMRIFNLSDEVIIVFNEYSPIMADLNVVDLNHIYGSLNHPIIGQENSMAELKMSLYEMDEIQPKLNDATLITEYTNEDPEKMIRLTLLPFQISNDDYKVVAIGGVYQGKWQVMKIMAILKDNSEFKIDHYIGRWSPKRVGLRRESEEEEKELVFTRDNQILQEDVSPLKGEELLDAQMKAMKLGY